MQMHSPVIITHSLCDVSTPLTRLIFCITIDPCNCEDATRVSMGLTEPRLTYTSVDSKVFHSYLLCRLITCRWFWHCKATDDDDGQCFVVRRYAVLLGTWNVSRHSLLVQSRRLGEFTQSSASVYSSVFVWLYHLALQYLVFHSAEVVECKQWTDDKN